MPKKDLFKNLFEPSIGGAANPPFTAPVVSIASLQAERKTDFAVKLILVFMVIAGVVMIDRGMATNSISFKQPLSNENFKSEQVLAAVTQTPIPKLLAIPSLKISAPFELLGLNPDHTIEVPNNDLSVGWFVYGAKPGEVGASVVVGHLDSGRGKAVFADLSKIIPGDKIYIQLEDGSTVIYRVDSLSKFPQDKFPTQAVYGAIPYAGLRLITCTGTWNKKAGHYSENLVVFATKI